MIKTTANNPQKLRASFGFISTLLPAMALLLLVFTSGCGQSHRRMGYELLKKGDYAAAEVELRRAINSYTYDYNAYLALGLVYQHKGMDEQARLVFLQLARNNPPALFDGDMYPQYKDKPVAELAEYLLTRLSKGADEIQALEQNILANSTRPASQPATAGKTSGTEPVGRGPTGAPGAFGVHVLSYKKALAAEQGREVLLARFPTLFTGKEFRSQRVDLNGKGVFHRLVTGPYFARQEAEKVCAELAKVYSYCQVVNF